MSQRRQMNTRFLLICALVLEFQTGTAITAEKRLTFKPCHFDKMRRIIMDLSWTTAALIQDEHYNYRLPNHIRQSQYKVTDVNSTAEMFASLHRLMFPDINLVLIFHEELMLHVLKQIDQMDTISRGTTDFRHHSKILLVVNSIERLNELEETVQRMENILVFVLHQCSSIQNTSYLYTLHIEQRRRFHGVTDAASSLSLTAMFPNTQYGYNNRRLVVSTLPNTYFVSKLEVNGKFHYSGYLFNIWRTIAKELNFSFVVRQPKDWAYGVKLKNGSWNGFVKQLEERDADVAVADFIVTYDRTKVIDFIYPPVTEEAMVILYLRTPVHDALLWLAMAFSSSVYVAILLTLLGTLCFYIVLEYVKSYEKPTCRRKTALRLARHLHDASFNLFSVAVRQDVHPRLLPKSNPGKILRVFWSFLMLILTSVYSANLVASLSSVSGYSDISTIEELAASDYTVGIYPEGSSFSMLKESTRPGMKMLYNKVMQLSRTDDGIFDKSQAAQIQRVKNGRHAYVIYRTLAKMIIREDCRHDAVKEYFHAERDFGFAVAKNSPLKYDIGRVISHLKESGCLNRWFEKWTVGSNISSCERNSQAADITLKQMSATFLLLGAGLFLSFIVLPLECSLGTYITEKRVAMDDHTGESLTRV